MTSSETDTATSRTRGTQCTHCEEQYTDNVGQNAGATSAAGDWYCGWCHQYGDIDAEFPES